MGKSTETAHFEVPDSAYVILEFNSDLDWIFKDVQPTTLSEIELAEIEKIIDQAVEESNDQQLEIYNIEHPDNQLTETGYELDTKRYKRQYIPVTNRDGEKEVWINFFCNDWENDRWKSDLVLVLDGGNCYFSLKVNLKTKTYSDLCINGYA